MGKSSDGFLLRVRALRTSDFAVNLKRGLDRMLSERTTRVYFSFLLFLLFLATFGPRLAPYQYDERLYADGELLRGVPPSLEHPLGTTAGGFDVLSRILAGARPTLLAGILGGVLIILFGLTIGLTAGYVGGRVDDLLMRITDFVYGVPLIPFALVLVAIMGTGYYQSIIIVGLVLWRGSARVIRSQVLQIKERPFIVAAELTGASTPHIIVKHILPNVGPMAVLFFALGTGYSIVIIAGLSFLGVTDPFTPSWGIIIRNAFRSGQMADLWWWSLPPGLLIASTVLSLFMFGRGYERVVQGANQEGGGYIAEAT